MQSASVGERQQQTARHSLTNADGTNHLWLDWGNPRSDPGSRRPRPPRGRLSAGSIPHELARRIDQVFNAGVGPWGIMGTESSPLACQSAVPSDRLVSHVNDADRRVRPVFAMTASPRLGRRRPALLEEFEHVGIDPIRLGRAHPMRKAGIDFQPGVLDQLGR